MVAFYGDYDTTETVCIPFNSFTSDDPSASVTMTDLIATDVEIYKDGSLTERNSGTHSGITVDIDVDTVAGTHWVTIDLSDNDDAGFYANGTRCSVMIVGTTIDGGTVNAWIGSFSIGCTLRPTTAGRTLDVSSTGEAGIDWNNVGTPGATVDLSATSINLCDTITTYTGNTLQTANVNDVKTKTDFLPSITAGTAGGVFIAGTNAATTITTGLTTTFTGNLTGSVGSVTGAVGSVTGAVGSVTGAVGSVAGNVDGNVTGSTGSVVGAVGSVTGAVGSVAGNVDGNVTGTVNAYTNGTYSGNRVYVDSVNGTATGAALGEGTDSHPHNGTTMAQVATIAGLVKTNSVYCQPGTTITLDTATLGNFVIDGDNYSVVETAVANNGLLIRNASISSTGTPTGTGNAWQLCTIGTTTMPPGVSTNGCTLDGTATATGTAAMEWTDLYGSGGTLDFNLLAVTAFDLHMNGGAITLTNLAEATTVVRLYGTGKVTIDETTPGTSNATVIDVFGDINIIDSTTGLSNLSYPKVGFSGEMAGSGFVTGTDSLEAIRDRGDAAWTTGGGGSDRLLMVDTTIATLASQISFTLTAGSDDNDAYNGCTIVIEDASTATQKAVGIIDDYVGSTKTVTLLEDPGVFTMVATDKVYILAEKTLKPTTAANYHVDVTAGGNVGIDWSNVETPGATVDLSATDINLCDTVTTNTDMVGTDNAALASVCTEARLAELDAANIPTDLDAVLVDTGTTIPNQITSVHSVTDGLVTTVDTVVDGIQTDLDNGTDGLGAIKTVVDGVQTDLDNATDGLGAIKTVVDGIQTQTLPATNSAFADIRFLMVASSDHVTPVDDAVTWTIEKAIDGAGSFTTHGGSDPANIGNGIYSYDAVADDMNGGVITFRFSAAGGTASDDTFVTIVTDAGV